MVLHFFLSILTTLFICMIIFVIMVMLLLILVLLDVVILFIYMLLDLTARCSRNTIVKLYPDSPCGAITDFGAHSLFLGFNYLIKLELSSHFSFLIWIEI